MQTVGSGAAGEIRARLADPSRSVRIGAAWALRAELDTNSPAGRELLHSLELTADQPAGQVQQGAFYFARGDLAEALAHFERAVAWDTNSAPIRREYAVALGAANRNPEALEQLLAACRLAPGEASYVFELGLAWNEAGDLPKAIEQFEKAVKLDAHLDRAWYNLGLARNAAGQVEPALDALNHAQAAAPNDPRIPYAAATILARAGRVGEAEAAARRALMLQPDFPEAAQLLRVLAR